MNFLTILYYLLFFIALGLYSVPTSPEAIGNERNISSSQTGLSEVSVNSKVSFFLSKLSVQQISEIRTRKVRNISDETRRLLKSDNLKLVISEKKWLSLLYLKENLELTIDQKGLILSQEQLNFFKHVELVDSWKRLNDWKRSNLKKNIPTLESLQKITNSEKLKGVFDDNFLKALSDVQKNAGTGSVPSMKDLFDNIESAFKELDLSKIEGLDLLKNELKRTDYGKIIGANWTLEYMGKNPDIFKRFNKIVFESVEKIDEVTGSIIRRVDVKATKGAQNVFFEFKSIQPPLPPKGFAEQFVKDLKLADVASLEQLKWVFDGKKVNSLVQKDFVDTLVPVKNELFSSKAKGLFEKTLGESFLDADDLISAIRSKDGWFKQVFQIIE